MHTYKLQLYCVNNFTKSHVKHRSRIRKESHRVKEPSETIQIKNKEECIPVGCVPPACRPYLFWWATVDVSTVGGGGLGAQPCCKGWGEGVQGEEIHVM